MGKKLNAIIGRAFRAAKCLTLLKLVQSRVRVMKNKRTQSAKQMRREIAHHLQSGQEVHAYNLKVDTLIKEENLVVAYELIDQFCHAIIMRMHVIETQKTCPPDMKEPIASLIYAAPRCPDLRELSEIREMFIAKYGKEFADAAAELRPDCGVNKLIIEKLTTHQATGEAKDKVMKDIARENMINRNPASEKTSTTSGGVVESSTPASQSGRSQSAGPSKPQDSAGRLSQLAGPSKPQESALTGTEALSLFSSRIQSQTSAASNTVLRMESHDETEWHDVLDKFDEDSKGGANNDMSVNQHASGKNSSSAGTVHSTSLHLHEERSRRGKAEEGTETMLGSNVSFQPPLRKASSRDSAEEYLHAGNAVRLGHSSSSDLKKPLELSPSPSVRARKERLANAAQAAFQSAAKATEAAQAAINMALRFPDEEATSEMGGNGAKYEDSIPSKEMKGDSQDPHSESLEKGDSKVEQQPTYSESSDDEDNSSGYKWKSQLSAGSDWHSSSLRASHVEPESPFSLPNSNSGGSSIDKDPFLLQHKDSVVETASNHVASSFETDQDSKPKFDDEGDGFEDSLFAETDVRFDEDYEDLTERYRLPTSGPLKNRHRPFFDEEEEKSGPDKATFASKLLEDDVFDDKPQVQLGRFSRSAVPKDGSTSIVESHFIEESEAEHVYPTSSSAKDVQEKGKSASTSNLSKLDDEEALDKKTWMQSDRFSKHIASQQSSLSFVKPHFDEDSEEDQVYPVRSARKKELKTASLSEEDEMLTARSGKVDDEEVLEKKPWVQSGRFSKHIAPQQSSISFVKPHFDEESEEEQVYPVRSAKKMQEEVKNASLSEEDETSTARASSKYYVGANRERRQAATQPQQKPLRWISKASRTEEDHGLTDEQMQGEGEPSTTYGLSLSRREWRSSAFNADKKQQKQQQLGVEQENEEDGELVSKLKLKAASPFENDQLISTSMLKPANKGFNDLNEDDSEPDDKPFPARYHKNIASQIERPNRVAAAPRKKFYEEDLEEVDQHPTLHSRMAAQLQDGLSHHTTRFSSGNHPTRKQTLHRDEKDPEEQLYSRSGLTSRLGARRDDHGLGVEDKLSSILSIHDEKHQKQEEDNGDEEEYLQLHSRAHRQDHRLGVDNKLSSILSTHTEKYQNEQEDERDQEEYLHLRSRVNHKVSARYTARKHLKQEDDEENKRLSNRTGFVKKQTADGENSEDEEEGERLPTRMGFLKKPMTYEQDSLEEEEKEFLRPVPTHKVGARYTAKKQPKQEQDGANKYLSSGTELTVEDEEWEPPQSLPSYRIGRPSLMAKPVSQSSDKEENLKREEEWKDKHLPSRGNRINLRLSTAANPARKQMPDDRVEMVNQEYLSKEESGEDGYHQPLPKTKEVKKYSLLPSQEDRYEHPSLVLRKVRYSQPVSCEDQLSSRSEEVNQETLWRPYPSVEDLKVKGEAGIKSSVRPEEEVYQHPSRRRYARPSSSLMEEVEDQKYHHSTLSTNEKQQRPLQGKTDKVTEEGRDQRPRWSTAAKTGKKWNEGVEEEARSTRRSEAGYGRLSSPMEEDEQQQPSLDDKYQEKYLFTSQGPAPSSAANTATGEIDQRRSPPYIESHQDVSLGMGSKKAGDRTRRPLYTVSNVTSSSTPQTPPLNNEQQDVSYNLPARKVEEMKFTSPTNVSDNVSKMEERPSRRPHPTTEAVPTLKTPLQQQESHHLLAGKVEEVEATPPTRLSPSLATSSIVNSLLENPTTLGVGSTSKASLSSSSALGRVPTAISGPPVESSSASVISDELRPAHNVSHMDERPGRPPHTVDTVPKPTIPPQQQEEGHHLPARKVEEVTTPPTRLSPFAPSLSMSSSMATSSITTSISDPTVLGVGNTSKASSSASSSALGKLPTAVSAPPVENSSASDTSSKSRLSHVHPKLPDVDDVFAALRQARRRRADGGDASDHP